MNTLDDLTKDCEAAPVWRLFAEISAVPRPSKQEEQIQAHLRQMATQRGWELREDAAGNLVFVVPGTGTLADAPTLVLQGHMDMVCEKDPDVDHDFTRDPIRLQTDGQWVTAQGTTLGADNGIAVALAIAVAEAPLADRVPLELLFTVDEETGLNGALDLDGDIVSGKQVLNLDSEEDGVVTIGCAGGVDMTITLTGTEGGNASGLRCTISGLRGGHSGVNIHEGRGNAIQVAAQLLDAIRQQSPALELRDFAGGSKKNAIPRDASFVISSTTEDVARQAASVLLATLRETETNADITWQACDASNLPILANQAIDVLLAVPIGVIAMDPNFPELVQTSNSVGVVTRDDKQLAILMHGRSSSQDAKVALVAQMEALCDTHDAELESSSFYPGWMPNPDSDLLKRCVTQYEALFGEAPEVAAVHAGLETGIIGDKLNTNELASVGPTIENGHSPSERLHIESTRKTYRFLQRLVSTA